MCGNSYSVAVICIVMCTVHACVTACFAADALNGAIEAVNCSVHVDVPPGSSRLRTLTPALPSSGLVVFVDPRAGSDERGTGAEGAPLSCLWTRARGV